MEFKKEAKKAKEGMIRQGKEMVHGFVRDLWNDFINFFILGAIFGVRKGGGGMNKKGSEEGLDKIGMISKMFHPFSDEDEIRWNQLFSFVRNQSPQWEENFMVFLEMVIKIGYDEDTLRNRLIGSFTKEEVSDAAVQTVKSISDLSGDAEKQVELAKFRHLLVKKSVKKAVLAIWRNKFASLLWLIVAILAIFKILTYIFA
jgi:hypothetical protein